MRWTFSPAVVPARRLGAAGFFLVFVMGFFSRLKSGLARTRVNLVGLFSGGVVDEEFFESLEETLIAADIGYKPTSVILQRLRDTVKLKGLKTREEVRAALRDEIERILLPAQKPMNLDAAKPLVIMMAGVNGAGKTTTIGKIAKWLAAQNKTVLLAAADTFRAAAREQLAVWGERNKIDVITQSGGDPAAVVFDAVSAGRARGTAGRLPTQTNLMEELARIRRSQGKAMEGAPHEVLLVVDGTNGQNALAQVKAFDQYAGLTGLIVTKLDGTAKGGVIFSVADQFGIPIRYIGVGERIEDLRPFNAGDFIEALFARED
jgi:fused signal recognition particle receptor